MNLLKLTLGLMFGLLSCMPSFAAERTKLNKNWKFFLGDAPSASQISFTDNLWRTVNVPHDWAFENGYSKDGAQEDRGGYASGGIGWYRKTISLNPNEQEGKRFYLDFDGVYMNSEVWVNGAYLGRHPYGYTSFSYDVTQLLHPGQNLISVRVDNSLEPSARWYHGCGIYGDVFLRTTNPVHFIKDGTAITMDKVLTSKANVRVKTEIANFNHSDQISLEMNLLDASGHPVITPQRNKMTLTGEKTTFDVSFNVKNFELWSDTNPTLYTLEMVMRKGKDIIDSQKINIGFRHIEWTIEKGFFLNGKQLKLRGVCDHLEAGPTGAITTEKILRWKLQLLKDMGCNAIRTAHNPQIPLFYKLCDEMGLLVMDEVFDGWEQKALHDYGEQDFKEWWEKDLRSFIRRDRNHPSVIVYSLGNETRGDVAKDLVRVCHEEDYTRLVTSGHSAPEAMDILGMNGASEKAEFLKSFKPTDKPFVATENPHTWQVRGYYRSQTWYRDAFKSKKQTPQWIPNLTDKEIFTYDWTAPQNKDNAKQCFNSSYDNATVRVTARHMIAFERDHDWYSGGFRWTGFDYLGEAGYVHGGWPFRAFEGGALDLAGFKKDLYYLYQSEWTDKPMVHILPHWTHPVMKAGTKIPVWVYTTGDQVELIVNNQSLGKKMKGTKWDEIQCEWLVPWQPGTIEAIAYKKGKEIARETIQTSGAPSKLAITNSNEALKADAEDIAIITLTQQDRKGTFYPYGENRVFTKIFGNASILSFESGNPVDDETNFGASSHRCFMGMNRLFVQSTGGEDNSPVSVVVGAINGDKRLALSNKISIDVKEVALRGKTPQRNLRITYTTDGTEPSTNSPVYTTPFAIKMGTTVKATVYEGNKRLLRMEENFKEGEGLYWGKTE